MNTAVIRLARATAVPRGSQAFLLMVIMVMMLRLLVMTLRVAVQIVSASPIMLVFNLMVS